MRPSSRAIPDSGNFSRFLRSAVELEEEGGGLNLKAMVAELRDRLMELLPDFGTDLGCDGKAVESWSTGIRGRDGKTSDPDANWGRHQTSGVNGATGKSWTKVKQ